MVASLLLFPSNSQGLHKLKEFELKEEEEAKEPRVNISYAKPK